VDDRALVGLGGARALMSPTSETRTALPDRLLTVAAAALEFGVTRRTVLHWIHSGKLGRSHYPAGQLRVSLAEIRKFQEIRRSIW